MQDLTSDDYEKDKSLNEKLDCRISAACITGREELDLLEKAAAQWSPALGKGGIKAERQVVHRSPGKVGLPQLLTFNLTSGGAGKKGGIIYQCQCIHECMSNAVCPHGNIKLHCSHGHRDIAISASHCHIVHVTATFS